MTFEKTTTMEQKIIQAARETFLKKGYKETNMSDIAAATRSRIIIIEIGYKDK